MFYCNSTQIRLHHLSKQKDTALYSIHLFCPFVVCFNYVNTHFAAGKQREKTKSLPLLYLCLLFKSLMASQLHCCRKYHLGGKN